MRYYRVWAATPQQCSEGELLTECALAARYPWVPTLLEMARDRQVAPTASLQALALVTDRLQLAIRQAGARDGPSRVCWSPPVCTLGWSAYCVTEWSAGTDIAEEVYREEDLPGQLTAALPLAQGEALRLLQVVT